MLQYPSCRTGRYARTTFYQFRWFYPKVALFMRTVAIWILNTNIGFRPGVSTFTLVLQSKFKVIFVGWVPELRIEINFRPDNGQSADILKKTSIAPTKWATIVSSLNNAKGHNYMHIILMLMTYNQFAYVHHMSLDSIVVQCRSLLRSDQEILMIKLFFLCLMSNCSTPHCIFLKNSASCASSFTRKENISHSKINLKQNHVNGSQYYW